MLFQHIGLSKRLKYPNLILIIGYLLSQNCLLFSYLSSTKTISLTWIQDTFFYICTLLQIIAFFRYLSLKSTYLYPALYQFVLLPIFSIFFIKQGNFVQDAILNSLRVVFFILGFSVCFVMLSNQYSRQNQQQSLNIMKISLTLRYVRLFKSLFFMISISFNLSEDFKTLYLMMLVFLLIEIYSFLTTFSFQNPYQQYLLMVSLISSTISWIQFICFSYELSSYFYIGQIVFIIILVTELQFFQKIIQLKYRVFAQRNVQTTHMHQILGIFSLMKEIIFDEDRSFNYTQQFQNQIYTILQKMSTKWKIQSKVYQQKQQYKFRHIFNEYQMNLLKLMQKKLKDSKQFIVHQFFLINIVRKQNHYSNKAIMTFYQRKNETNLRTRNIFNKVQTQLLYRNLAMHMKQQKKFTDLELILKFNRVLFSLKQEINNLCKKQISFIGSLQNSITTSYQKHQDQILQRNQLKQRIQGLIDGLNQNYWHIYSANYLYICLLYKFLFSREQLVIQDKIINKFMIPFHKQRQRISLHLQNIRNTGVVVFSVKQKGLIINENEIYSKKYGKVIKSHKKCKKYISDLFICQKQKNYHQDLMQSVIRFDDENLKDHSEYQCLISKKMIFNLRSQKESHLLISVVQKVQVSAKLYFESFQSQSFICSITSIDDNYKIKVDSNQLQAFKLINYTFRIVRQQTISQLGQDVIVYEIVLGHQQTDSVYTSDSQDSEYNQNISQNLMNGYKNIGLEDQKYKKVQKQLQKQKLKYHFVNIPMVILFLSFLFISLLFPILNEIQMREIQIFNSYLSAQRIIFKNTLLNQKLIGLQFIVYRMADQGLIKPNMCQNVYIPNIQTYLQNSLINYSLNNVDELQQVDISKLSIKGNLANVFNSEIYHFQAITIDHLFLSYKKYLNMMQSVLFEYTTSFDSPEDQQSFYDTIKQAIKTSEIEYKGIYNMLRLKFKETYQDLLNTLKYTLMIKIFINIVSILLILNILYKILRINYNHLQLLMQLKKPYLQNRIRQIQFLSCQLQKIDKNTIRQFKLTKQFNLYIKEDTGVLNVDLIELEKLSYLRIPKYGGSSRSMSMISSSQIDEEKQKLFQNDIDDEEPIQKVSFWNIIFFNKLAILYVTILTVLLIEFQVMQTGYLQNRAIKTKKFQQNMYESGILLNQINNLLIGQWLKYKQQDQFSNQVQNDLRVQKALNVIQNNNFKQQYFSLFSKNISDKIFYSSYCKDDQLCSKIKQGSLSNGLVPMLSFLVTDYKSVWMNPLSQNVTQIIENQLCQKLVIFLNFTIKQFPQNVLVGVSEINNQFVQAQEQVMISQSLVLIFLGGIVLLICYKFIQNSHKVRQEVLSMDSVKNLYKSYQCYRTYINELYYRNQQE